MIYACLLIGAQRGVGGIQAQVCHHPPAPHLKRAHKPEAGDKPDDAAAATSPNAECSGKRALQALSSPGTADLVRGHS